MNINNYIIIIIIIIRKIRILIIIIIIIIIIINIPKHLNWYGHVRRMNEETQPRTLMRLEKLEEKKNI